MAEFLELPQQYDTVDESKFDPSIHDDFLYNWLINYILNFGETGSISEERDSRVIQEKNILLEITTDLQNIIIYLLEEKIKMLDMQKNVLVAKVNFLELLREILKKYEDFLKNGDANKESHLQEYPGLFDSALKEFQKKRKEILSENAEKNLDEIYKNFLKYQEVYKTCESSLSEILRNSANKLDIDNIPRNYQEDFCILISILKENLTSCNVILASSKKAFHHFQTLLTNDLIVTGQKLSKRICMFMTVFDKVELAYRELFSVLFEVLNLDCASRALY